MIDFIMKVNRVQDLEAGKLNQCYFIPKYHIISIFYRDLSMSKRHGHILRIEVDNRPKSLNSDHSLSNLKVSPVCFTDKTDDEIMGHFRMYSGAYHMLGNNCIHQTRYLLNFVCGAESTHKALQPYDKVLYKVSRSMLQTFRSKGAKKKAWVVKEYLPREEFALQINL
jgi:hypothetical protein